MMTKRGLRLRRGVVPLVLTAFAMAIALIPAEAHRGFDRGTGATDRETALDPAQGPIRQRRNFFGIHNLRDGGAPYLDGLNWTRHLVGEGGFALDWVNDDTTWIKEVMDRGLIPVIRVQGGDRPDVGWTRNVAATISNWQTRMGSPYQNRLIYLQLWNEPGDPRDYVPEGEYADYLVSAYQAVREADANGTLRVVTPGQNGPDWWRRAFSHNPQAAFAFDVWGTHPYPESYPPSYNHHDSVPFINQVKTIDSYLLDLDVVAEFGRRGFPVLIAETAYGDHLGISYEGYPKTTRETAAEYMVSAYNEYWYNWPEVIGVNPFLLNAWAWDAFAWVKAGSGSTPDGLPTSPYPIYDAVRAIPKPPPALLEPYRGAVGVIRGTVRRTGGGDPIQYATVYTDGHEFGGPTLFDGQYVVREVPVGTYTLTVDKVGYNSASQEITVREGQETVVDFALTHTGKVSQGIYFQNKGTCSGCDLYAPFLGQTFKTSSQIGFIKFAACMPNVGNVTMRFSILDGGPNGPQVGDPVTAYLEWGGEMIGAEWPGDGVPVQANHTYFLKCERADGQSVYAYATDANPYPDGMAYTGTTAHPGWDLFATVRGITLPVEGASGSIAGRVGDPAGNPLEGASVKTTPGGYTTTTNADGRYLLAGLQAGTYSLSASRVGYVTRTETGVQVTTGQTTEVDFTLTPEAGPSPTTPPPTTPGPVDPSVSNADFEAGGIPPASWSGFGATDKFETVYGGYQGSWSGGVKDITTTGQGLYQRVQGFQSGQSYRVSVYFKTTAGTPEQVNARLLVDVDGGTAPAGADYASGRVDGSASWQQLSLDFTTKGEAATLFLEASADLANFPSWALFDLVEVRSTGGTPPTPAPTTPVPSPAPTTPGPSPVPTTPVPPPTSTPVDGSGPEVWDSRLDDLGIYWVPAEVQEGASYWRLISAVYEDENESGGTHHVYYKALDENGDPIEGQAAWAAWPTGNPTTRVQIVTKGSLDGYWGNFAMAGGNWCPFYPEGPRGPYGAYVDGAPSDQVWGMGMPCNRHVNYRLIWQWTRKGLPPVETPTPRSSFSDVLPDHWAFRYVEALFASGITAGCSTDPPKFCPDDPVVRRQMAVFLERGMRGGDYVPPSASGAVFTDVPASYPNAAWIEKLAADGITEGCRKDPPAFCPEDPVTREQIAVFLVKASRWPETFIPPPASGAVFTDVPTSHWSARWIEQLAADGVTEGCSKDPPMYCPLDTLTRAQMAVFLVRAFDLPMPGEPDTPTPVATPTPMSTATSIPTGAPSPTPTGTPVPTRTPTRTASPTPLPTRTGTATPPQVPTATPIGAPPFAIGLDPGAPISASTGGISFDGARIRDSGSTWVRINFILGPWSAPGDATRRGPGSLTWFETYDRIVNDAVARGLRPYGLIGGEAVHSSHPINSDAYVADYVANFAAIVDHFKDRVRYFESFNEPNDWAGGTSAQVTPTYFAKMLEQIYRAVKVAHWNDAAWRGVTLISGPLFSHDQDTVAPYFTEVWRAGVNQLGWGDLKDNYGTYPLDGLGYHLYVAQGTADRATVQSKMKANLDAIWGALTALEGSSTAKRLWISEIGWNTASVSEADQAANVDTALDLLRADPRVVMTSWFQLRDFGETFKWGLERADGSRKPGWARFVAQAGSGPVPSPTPGSSATASPVPTVAPTPTSSPGGPPVQNHDFEAGGIPPASWNGYGAVDKFETVFGGYSGVRSGGVKDITTAGQGLYQRVSGFQGGQRYRLSAYFKTTYGAPEQVNARLRVDLDGGTDVSGTDVSGDWVDGSGSWQELTLEFTAKQSVVTAFLEASADWANYPSWALFDLVTFERVGGSIPTPTSPPGPTPTPIGTSPPPGGPNLIANGGFEDGFTGDVANRWSKWSATGTGYWKQSSRLGRIGTGSYSSGNVGDQKVFDVVVRMNPKVVLLEGNALGMAQDVRRALPDALILGRLYIDHLVPTYLSNPEYYGRVHAENVYAVHQDKGGVVNAWQGLNEPFVNEVEDARRAARFEKSFSDRLHELGLKSVVFNIAVGNPARPNPDPYGAEIMLLPEVVDLLASADYVGYHAYGGINDQLMVGPESPWFAHRWRFYANLYAERGLRMPPVIYTEATTFYAWKGPNGYVFQPEQIRDDLVAFEGESRQDPWSVGLAIFLVGSSSPQWDGWEVGNEPVVYQGVGDYNWSHPADAKAGIWSQQFGSDGGAFNGGVVQVVSVEPGKTYRITTSMKLETDGPEHGVAYRVGYDLSGQVGNGNATSVVWSDDLIAAEGRETDIWYTASQTFTATGNTASIWVSASQGPGFGGFRVSLDEVVVEGVGA